MHTIFTAPFTMLATALLISSCSFHYDMVSFNGADKLPAAKTPVPKIEIDTNTSVGTLLGGSVKSKKPYDIWAYYMDDKFTFASAEFSALKVTYADGTQDPVAAALKLPMRFEGTAHESYNSMDGGVVVVNKSRIIKAEFPRTIGRDEPFTLEIEGKFTKENGAIIPFRIKQKYEISREKRTESWVDFVSSC
ncbi:MAG: hypothetical protein MUF13_10480 [Akkermansiaceae bacterium]|nr:hypothetical protein [Akkermansiaceae bacterium]